jgi:predicted RNA-binding Zn-ribbon protein involved in translation (DUF1610 family)
LVTWLDSPVESTETQNEGRSTARGEDDHGLLGPDAQNADATRVDAFCQGAVKTLCDSGLAAASLAFSKNQNGSLAAWVHQLSVLSWTDMQRQANDRIVLLAMNQSQPMLIEPKVSGEDLRETSGSRDTALSPTQLLAFVPVLLDGMSRVTLELVTESTNKGQPLTTEERQRILGLLQILSDCLSQRLAEILPKRVRTQSLADSQNALQSLVSEIELQRRQIRLSIERRLRPFFGKTHATFAANQTFAREIHRLLDENGLRVRCPECGTAAILRCNKSRSSESGYFVFDHQIETGRTFHGGTRTVPVLTLVDKPPRKTKRSA